MTPKPKPEPKPRVVLDTSVWLLACASKQLGENMSELDIQYREKGLAGNPDKMRGVIVDALLNKRVIVPDTVLHELQGLASGGNAAGNPPSGKLPKLNNDNIRNIRALTGVLENRTTKIQITREAAALQKEIWDEIKDSAKTNPEINKTWEHKFASHNPSVIAESKKAEENHAEPWIHAKNRIEALRMANLTRPSEKNRREINELKKLIEATEPKLVPDFEIMLCAFATQSELVSFDKDFAVMWAALPEAHKIKYSISTPRVGQRINDTSSNVKTPEQLAKTIETRVSPFVIKKKPAVGDPYPNLE